MQSQVAVAAIQLTDSPAIADNLARARQWITAAAQAGCRLILLPEMFATGNFVYEEDASRFALAQELGSSSFVADFRALARQLQVVLPLPVFEKASDGRYYNSVLGIDADGAIVGLYRKSHIPPGRAGSLGEKYYFSPGNRGFQVWQTVLGKIGVGICYDWNFPETGRTLGLLGAEVLLAPFATGRGWEVDGFSRLMHGLAGAAALNLCPLLFANLVARRQPAELWDPAGGTRIFDDSGECVAQVEQGEGFCRWEYDWSASNERRRAAPFRRDRRPEIYYSLFTPAIAG